MEAGGYKTKRETSRLGNVVSAVLHHMKTSGEVETNELGGHSLTEDGRHKWSLIKQGARFKAATSGSTEQTLLSAQ